MELWVPMKVCSQQLVHHLVELSNQVLERRDPNMELTITSTLNMFAWEIYCEPFLSFSY